MFGVATVMKRKNNVIAVIHTAIKKQQVIQLRLGNRWRTVEPYQTGIRKGTQESVVYGYCRDVIPAGAVPGRWQMFNLDEIDAVELTNYSFQPHVDYIGQCDCFQMVFSRVRPLWHGLTAGFLPVRTSKKTIRKIRFSK